MSIWVEGRFDSDASYRIAVSKATLKDSVRKWELEACGSMRGCTVAGCDGSDCLSPLDPDPPFPGKLNERCVQVKLHRWIRAQMSRWPDKVRPLLKARLATGMCLHCGSPAHGLIWHERCRSYQEGEYRKHLGDLLEEQRWMCAICGCSLCVGDEKDGRLRAAVDHVIPVGKKMNRGAVMDIRNLQATCLPCNRKKGSSLMPGMRAVGRPGHQYPVMRRNQ